ncbi:UDP-N-acetylmuramoyl-L-alanyl-D-glutamate--2,6-diaminopimelate ligase [bacterium]|nr:MAG: UDP-N-acetylmuramoyl-L-alanyl-D-glutamate--2,6-diaminopimelate ligase [bacterium]
MKLHEVMKDVPDIKIVGPDNIEVKDIRYDSRRVHPGDMFAAIPGENYDGAKFIGQAMNKGAQSFLTSPEVPAIEGYTAVQTQRVRLALALASRNFYERPSEKLKVIGITGTNGKTTTSYLLHGILDEAGVRAGLIGTVQYLVGGEVLSAARTTPESPDLNSLMTGMLSTGSQACILEVSSHAVALDRIAGMRMEVGVFTNLTRDHLDFHRDMEDYYRAKARLFLEEDTVHRAVNLDDSHGKRLVEEIGEPVLTYGLKEGDVRLNNEISTGEWGSRFALQTPWGELDVDTSLPGLFNVSNIMAAVCAAGLLDVEIHRIAEGIKKVQRVPGRFERVDRGQLFSAVVDYAHTPDALENLLENAGKLTLGRTIVVFGCGGDRDRAKRPLMGEVAERLADFVIVTSDNPRSEEPEAIIDDIMDGLHGKKGFVQRITDRREAIALAVGEAKQGDMVVVAGKGHENYQIVGKKVLPFSDVDELANAIIRSLEGAL